MNTIYLFYSLKNQTIIYNNIISMGNIIYININDHIVQLLVCERSKILEETFKNYNINAKKTILNSTLIF
jgi:hypothetical protein